MPRLLVVNPNTTASMTLAIGETARAAASAGTEVVARNPAVGPAAIEGPEDQARCLAPLLAEVERGAAEGFDGTAIACFDDPGVEAARTRTGGPVVGIAEAAMRAASAIGSHWGVVTTVAAAVPGIEELTRRYGVASGCVGVRAADVGVLALERPDATTRARVLGAVSALVRERGARAIVLGCAGMSTLREDIERTCGVRTIDGVTEAIRFLEVRLRTKGMAR